MKEKMKGVIDRSSYTKLYIYVGIIILCVVLYLFVFRDTSNKDSILLARNETSTVVIGNQNQETAVDSQETKEELAPAPAETKPETPVVTPEQPKTPEVAPTTNNNQGSLIPAVAENQIYANLETHSFTVNKGQTAGTIFAKNRADIYAMAAVNKTIERLGENDKIFVKYNSSGKIVVLSIEKRRGGFVGQYILNIDNNYIFVK
ncbi:hypothetical protein CKF54_03495 [Psittacicella hinzii]|uniref:Opacity-associated protein A LysM-like domain-containing protein n=1 Tax=Psittacicella hinzii TaxID=2028575 RepID=A0A3A1Y743_9GAMM|nr:LysM-like peptidoglycan-binding domain-containing protein [Psittacicella hinzii]RIY33126.1 hypothetical protein CKF54_03495 [Psittacicella hinzii]